MDKLIIKYYITILIAFSIILIMFIPLLVIFNKRKSSSSGIKIEFLSPPNPKNIKSIKVLRAPDKIEYKEGENFDKSGMILKAIYEDNTQSYINDNEYEINIISPLTIYDSKISFSYKGKTTFLNIIITNEEQIEIQPNFSNEKYTLETKEGITRFEIEDSDISNWIISKDNNINKIIERKDSSRGSFLSGIDEEISNEGKLSFNLDLKYNAIISMNVSYSQNEKWKNKDINISSIYTFIVNNKKIIEIEGENILKSRDDITKWQIIKYKSFILPKGKHTLSIKSIPNSKIGSPNIDYIDFETIKIDELPIEPDEEEDDDEQYIILSDDFHTLLQYQYIMDKPENIANYVNGQEDFSRPKGNILNFTTSVKEISPTYVIEISSSEKFDTSDAKIIKDLKEKYYIIKNLRLGQQIYYRGAINEDQLKNSKIYSLTVNTLTPRNLDIPGIDNCRDIGGVKTTLVTNGIIKQGLYYRSAQLDSITEEGKKVLVEDLGIKIEIDLRDEYEANGPYVEGVEYYPFMMYSGNEIQWFDGCNDAYVKVFNLIAESDKNPIIIHCIHGADRTGAITFALMTLLGCEYDDITRDYCFTNFGYQGFRNINTHFTTWWNKLDNFDGETKAERCKSWLMSKGIEESILEHIRTIFIDGYNKNISLESNKNNGLDEYENEYKNKKFLNFLERNDNLN